MPFDIKAARDAGYSDSDIGNFLAQQNPKFNMQGALQAGYSLDEIAGELNKPPAKPEGPVSLEGLYKSLDIGTAKGIAGLAALPRTVSDLATAGIQAGQRALGYEPSEGPSAASQGLPSYEDILGRIKNNPRLSYGGQFYEPQNMWERGAERAGTLAPGALLPGGLIARALTVAAPTIAGQTVEELGGGPLAQTAAEMASPFGVAAARRAVTPFTIGPGRQQAIQTLQAEGVQPTAGQQVGNRTLQYAESVLGDSPGAGARASRATEAQSRAFTQAALRRMGVQGEPTVANVNRTVSDMENEFRRLSQQGVTYDNQLMNDLTAAQARYQRKLPSQQREIVQNYVNDITDAAPNIPGNTYQVTRSDLSRQAHAARNTDPAFSDALRGIRNALDAAAERSLPQDLRGQWANLRQRWGNFRTLENALSRTDAEGNIRITPAA